MGRIRIEYTEAAKRYPAQVQKVMDKLRKGNSKHKESKPEDLAWEFKWCERIECVSLGDMLSGKQAAPPPEDFSNVFVSLQGKIRKFWADGGSVPVPEELKRLKQKQKAEEEKEKAEFDAKTPQERDAELKELTQEFLKGGGMIFVTKQI